MIKPRIWYGPIRPGLVSTWNLRYYSHVHQFPRVLSEKSFLTVCIALRRVLRLCTDRCSVCPKIRRVSFEERNKFESSFYHKWHRKGDPVEW